MAKKTRRAKSRKAAVGKVGNWGSIAWKDATKSSTNKQNDRHNKTVAKAFK